jgi:hypothetical protein
MPILNFMVYSMHQLLKGMLFVPVLKLCLREY